MTDELLGVGMPCGGKMDVYIEPVLPQPELLIVGHGRIAEVLAKIAALMNFSVTVNDPAADRARLSRSHASRDRGFRSHRGLPSVPGRLWSSQRCTSRITCG